MAELSQELADKMAEILEAQAKLNLELRRLVELTYGIKFRNYSPLSMVMDFAYDDDGMDDKWTRLDVAKALREGRKTMD